MPGYPHCHSCESVNDNCIAGIYRSDQLPKLNVRGSSPLTRFLRTALRASVKGRFDCLPSTHCVKAMPILPGEG